ncbi:MAG: C40 family peptidase [Chitinophagales bacterium]|nr:C40 family peptidase [Bacteroidota bacterium]
MEASKCAENDTQEIKTTKTNNKDREATIVKILETAYSLQGTPYKTMGTSPSTGFDCSGFVNYCFAQNGVSVPRSSKEQIKAGKFVEKCDAKPGDIIVFTGTNAEIREAGHSGIVIENNDCSIEFIHSSSSKSNNGVVISSVESTNYSVRFLQVRRVVE